MKNVADFMSDNALQFIAIESGQQSGSYRHRGVLRIAPRRKGIGGRVVDNVNSRHFRQIGRNGHLFYHIE